MHTARDKRAVSRTDHNLTTKSEGGNHKEGGGPCAGANSERPTSKLARQLYTSLLSPRLRGRFFDQCGNFLRMRDAFGLSFSRTGFRQALIVTAEWHRLEGRPPKSSGSTNVRRRILCKS
jgi:hypothetical protein